MTSLTEVLPRDEKWAARALEWRRLAGLAADTHVRAVCESLAEQAEMMTRFWQQWR